MADTTTLTPHKILKEKFGYDSFRPKQEEVINHVLNGQDALVLMPTGGGKSLCYQVPALIFKGVTIVISPLIALMKDQVDALRLNGVAAAYLNSSLSAAEAAEVIRRFQANELKLLYLAPERLLQHDRSFLNLLKESALSCIAIDEAHCISQWGHDFRPEYTQLAALKDIFPNVPVIALTATADKVTQADILKQLNLHQPKVFLSSFNRPNIHYFVAPKRESYDQLLGFLEQHSDDSGIIYTLSRASTESIAARLKEDGYDAKPYHAGLNNEIRQQHQELFIKDHVKIIVATIAFGMGIDKSNVRFVVHMDLPKNIEGYYQETGRAGRDGLKSDALLFYSYADVMKLQRFAEVDGNTQQTEIMLNKLRQMGEFGQLRTCRRKYLLNYFDEEAPDNCGSCDVCLGEQERFDGTLIAQKVLSAVARLEERFGAGYVIDFLRGSKSEKIRDRHKQLKTYGVGQDISKKEWSTYIDDLIQLGYLAKDTGEYPVLKLTEKSRAVLKGEELVMLFKIEDLTYSSSTESSKAIPVDKGLFENLRKFRMTIADSENVAPYMVFSDATLNELATYRPLIYDDLTHISGFGAVKLEKYGQVFLEVLQSYCEEHGLSSAMEKKTKRRVRKSSRVSTVSNTKQETFQMFKEGLTIAQIAERRGLSATTIESHLSAFITAGKLDVLELVPQVLYDEIVAVATAIKEPGLKPIKESLREEITYGQIRMVMAAVGATG